MNYNAEDIQQITEEVAKLVQESIRQQGTEHQESQTMAEIELAFREALRRIGAEALGMFLSDLQQTPENEIACGCGGTLHYQRMRPAVTTIVFGKVVYCRARTGSCRSDIWFGSGRDQFRLGATHGPGWHRLFL